MINEFINEQVLNKCASSKCKFVHENELLSLQARELKKSADAILNEVRKKINDVTKTMDLLKGIQKLRKLRSDRLKQQGEIYVYCFVKHVCNMLL